MIILAIDTSCDDTAIAVIEAKVREYQREITPKFKTLSNVVSSQVKLHRKYGGVYPTLAKREHQKNLVPVLKKALREANLLQKSKILNLKSKNHISKVKSLKKILSREEILFENLKVLLNKYQKPKVDAIAVTVGPGLEPCLWVGVNFAKALGCWWNVPIIPVNHIEAHAVAGLLLQASSNFQFSIFNFQKSLPAICLVVSGGHTQLILVEKIGKYKIIGETRDDAAGECFDKTARILGLTYPGGPAIAQQAGQWKFQIPNSKLKITLPRPMIHSKDYDFSFSGLKTAVLYEYRKQPDKVRKSKEYIRAMAKEIQRAIIDVLIAKTIKVVNKYNVKSIMLGGGVAANEELRKQFNYKLLTTNYKLNFLAPPKNLCTDNAAMIGATAYFHLKDKIHWKQVKTNSNLRV